ALKLAIEAAPPVGEEAAWLHHQLGDVHATLGDFERSERVNRLGTKLAPGYVPPTVGIAESYIARGRYKDALPIMERAARDLPALEYLVTLGDLYWATGDRKAAVATYDNAAHRFALYRANGVLPDHDFVSFYADHRLRPRAALGEARFIYDNRPTAAAADTLAWALHAIGRDRAALHYVRRALEGTTTPDAAQHFHAAAIHHSLGHEEAARRLAREALRLDPHFSLFHLDMAEHLAEW
ncbi:MAG TPA: tetratricopeptide repeat protein, partial [Vicinamibacterales bacterium]|nr:tetratricopeptide repeat protein [Vicinamibacterales bacterium]